jgi:peptidyl-Lys metalloendopeptidase
VILNQQVQKIGMETNKQMLFNNKMKYHLNADDSYVKDSPILINFTLQNFSDEDLWVLSWYTPLEGLKGKIFSVTCDGKQIPYEGVMVKRGQPLKSDYIHIDPGSFVSKKVDLSSAYKIPPSQACVVEFKDRIYDFTTSGDLISKRSEEHQRVNITGNSITFSVVNA